MEKITKTSISFLIFSRFLFLIYASKLEKIYLTKDSDHYLELSSNISYYFLNDNLNDYWLSTFRMPGYPLLINIFHKIFDVNLLIFVNFIADLLTLYLIYKILFKYYDSTIACIGCIIFLINPNSLISSTQIMTESISTTLLFTSFYFFDEKKYTFSGLSVGLLGIIKPLGLYVVFFYLILLILRRNKKLTNYFKIALFPVILIGSVYVNNYIQYETSFYSTSSSFHMQWFNTASNNICKNYDFNELEVSEPGYVFENWLLENNLSKQSDSKILINKLKLDSKIGFFKNVHCKLLSISRSTVWNMFGIRGSNWESISDNNYVYLSIRLFSLIYVSLINFSLLRMVLSKNKSDFLLGLLLITVGYIVVSSILPFGNSRTRVLIEPFLVIIFVCSLRFKNVKS
jgi:Gpi18-like mannosyltransferase